MCILYGRVSVDSIRNSLSYTYPEFSYISGSLEGGIQYVRVPPDIIVRDFIIFLTQLIRHHTTHIEELYRHGPNGYIKTEMDERLISGNPNEVETFLIINR